jgi:hypothetical protein
MSTSRIAVNAVASTALLTLVNLLSLVPLSAAAFDSGSDGSYGPMNA